MTPTIHKKNNTSRRGGDYSGNATLVQYSRINWYNSIEQRRNCIWTPWHKQINKILKACDKIQH